MAMELVMSVGVIAVFTVAALDIYAGLRTFNLENTPLTLLQHIRLTHKNSMMGKNGNQHGIHFESTRYTLYQGEDYESRDEEYDQEFSLPEDVVLCWSLFGAEGMADEINFTKGFGIPDNIGIIIATNLANNLSSIIRVDEIGGADYEIILDDYCVCSEDAVFMCEDLDICHHPPATEEIDHVCDGKDATIYVANNIIVGGPDDGDEYTGVLMGSNKKDVIVGTYGDDIIYGDNGDDIICALDGNNTVYGENGKDRIFTGSGDDIIQGGNGKDLIIAYGGNNNVNAGGDNGKDIVCTGNEDDIIEGGNGNDSIDSNGGVDIIYGGHGTDVCLDGEHIFECEETLACGDNVPAGCDKCKGKVSELTLKYNGIESANIQVKQKNKEIIFNAMVNPGEEFSFTGTDKGILGTEIKIYKNYNGDDDDDDDDDDHYHNYFKIHTSCSREIGPGLIVGEFEVMSGQSKDGGPLCRVDCEYIPECNVEYYSEEGIAICHYLREYQYTTRTMFVDEVVVPTHLYHGDVLNVCDYDIEARTITINAVNLIAHLDHGDGIGACETVCHWFPPQEEECGECSGKVTDLSLRFNGVATSTIKVKQKNNDIVFNDIVGPGQEFSFFGTDKGTLGTQIKIYINDDGEGDDDDDDSDYIKIHTSCSKEIGSGLIVGDFEVVFGHSKNGGLLCPMPCSECDGGVTDLSLEFVGYASVNVVAKNEDNIFLFDNAMSPGEVLSFSGTNNETLGSEVRVYINGGHEEEPEDNYDYGFGDDDDDDDCGDDDFDEVCEDYYVAFPTDCSEEIGPNFKEGYFIVTEGESRHGGSLCPLPIFLPEGCAECDGGVNYLKLKYNGDYGADIIVKKGYNILFDHFVRPNEEMSFTGKDGGSMGSEIKIYKNYNGDDDNDYTSIHTSCSIDIGIGLVADDFEIIDGASKNGGPLCFFEGTPDYFCGKNKKSVCHYPPGNPENFHSICISSNAVPAHLAHGDVLGECIVKPEGAYVTLKINREHLEAHLAHGDTHSACAEDEDYNQECAECDGKVSSLSLQFNGNVATDVRVKQKDHAIIFSKVVLPGEIFSFNGIDKGALGTEIKIYENYNGDDDDDDDGSDYIKIHTSCSKPIGPGLVVGSFEVIGGESKKGGLLCDL